MTNSAHAFKVLRRYHFDNTVDEQFSHDMAGNLLSQFAKDNNTLAETQGNRLTFHGDCHYEYDSFGNLIAEKRGKGQQLVTRYHYQHQLIKLEKHDGTVAHYQYDAFGRRIQKTVTDAETHTTQKTTFGLPSP